MTAYAIADRVRIVAGEHAGTTGQVLVFRRVAGDPPDAMVTIWPDEGADVVLVYASDIEPEERRDDG